MKVLLEFANAERLYPAFANMEDIRIDGLYTNSTLCGYDNSEFLNITVNSLYRAVDLYKKRLIDAFIICDTPRIETLKDKSRLFISDVISDSEKDLPSCSWYSDFADKFTKSLK